MHNYTSLIIAAAGTKECLIEGQPKQLAMIAGETLLARLLRQFKAIDRTYVLTNKKALLDNYSCAVPFYDSQTTIDPFIYGIEQNFHLQRTYLMYGDVVLSEPAAKTILDFNGEFGMFGTGAEPFVVSFTSNVTGRVKECLDKAHALKYDPDAKWPTNVGNLWIFYRLYLGLPVHIHDWGANEHYHIIDDGSLDLDLPENYQVLKSRFERTVFTSGTFDGLTPRVIDFLWRAKGLGQNLIVGVDTDEAAIQRGGKPQYTFDQRQRMVKELRCVDEVVPNRALDDYHYLNHYRAGVIAVGAGFGIRDRAALTGREIVDL